MPLARAVEKESITDGFFLAMEKRLQPNSYSINLIVTFALTSLSRISYNESHVCDVAPSPTRAKGHVAERRAAAPRSPRHPEGVPMYIRAVM